MKSKKTFAKVTCEHCGERVEVDPFGGQASVPCPHCGRTFAVSLLGAAPRKKAATPARPVPLETDRPAPDLAPEPEDDGVDLPFQPLLSPGEETSRSQSRESARVPFAPLQGQATPTTATAPVQQDAPEKPPQASSFYQWVLIVVLVAVIGVVLYFIPLGENEPPGRPKDPPTQPGPGGDPEEEELALLDKALFEPPLSEPPEVATVAEVAYPFPLSLSPWIEP